MAPACSALHAPASPITSNILGVRRGVLGWRCGDVRSGEGKGVNRSNVPRPAAAAPPCLRLLHHARVVEAGEVAFVE